MICRLVVGQSLLQSGVYKNVLATSRDLFAKSTATRMATTVKALTQHQRLRQEDPGEFKASSRSSGSLANPKINKLKVRLRHPQNATKLIIHRLADYGRHPR